MKNKKIIFFIFIIFLMNSIFMGCKKIQNQVIIQPIQIKSNTVKENIKQKEKMSEEIANILMNNKYDLSKLNISAGEIETEWKALEEIFTKEEYESYITPKKLGYVHADFIKLSIKLTNENYEITPLLKRNDGFELGFEEEAPYVYYIEEIVNQINKKLGAENLYKWEIR